MKNKVLNYLAPLAMFLAGCSSPETYSVNRTEPLVSLESNKDVKKNSLEKKVDSKKLIERVSTNEGFKEFAYNCTEGKRTVGYGFNLDRGNAKEILEKYRQDFEAIYSGKKPLPKPIAYAIFCQDLKKAREQAKKEIPNIEELNPTAQEIIYDAFYQMHSLTKFPEAINHLRNGNLYPAALELEYKNGKKRGEKSKLYNQSGNRWKRQIEELKHLAKNKGQN